MIKKVGQFRPYLFICLNLLLASCQKEYSFEGGPQAAYVIEGSPTTCMPATISGFYIAGSPTGAGNTLQLTVDVNRSGNYTIFSLPADGISFSTSGNFADTGIHVVTLQCAGIPDTVGTALINIYGDNGCFVTVNVLKKAPASYSLVGYPVDCSSPTIAGNYIAGTNIMTSNTLTLQVIVNTPGNYKIATDTIDGFSFSTSGTFGASGTQTVVLNGLGIPDSPGLWFFTVHSDSSQCDFSIPVRSAEPLATYVLQSGTGASSLICSPQSIQGTYTAGVALNSTNTITISPYATLPGNYAISTGRINGILFSASGNFQAAGPYLIALKGTGTPLAAGTFTFTPFIIGPAPIGGKSCDVTITVN